MQLRRRPVRRRPASRRPPYLTIIAVAVVMIGAIIGVSAHGGSSSSRNLHTAAAASVSGIAISAETTIAPDPTPNFAQYGSLKIHLPVAASAITALAFHQASFTDALPMTSLVPDADMTLATKLKAVPPVSSVSHGIDDGSADVWDGQALRLWRSSRYGKPDTAVDCGADAGTTVLAPISGTVQEIKSYMLYGKYPDYEIHIKPTGRSDIEVVLIHVTDLTIAKGDTVQTGITPIAHVRCFSSKMTLQLGEYTKNGGDHVHLQINRVTAENK